MVKRIGTVRSKRDKDTNRKFGCVGRQDSSGGDREFLPNDAIKKGSDNEKSDGKVKATLGVNGGGERVSKDKGV